MKPKKEDLVKDYINLLYYFAIRWIGKEKANDLVQDTYLKVFKNYSNFNFTSEKQLKSWMLTICHNLAVNSLKEKKTVTFKEELENETVSENNIDTWLETEIKKDQSDSLEKEFKLLENNERDILQLRFYEDFSFKEIS